MLLSFFLVVTRRPPTTTLFPYTTLFRSRDLTQRRLGRGLIPMEMDRHGGAGAGQPNADGVSYAAISTGHDRHLIRDRKSTRLNSSHVEISYAVFCLKKKKII